jgi:hypothetical protein
VNKAPPYAPRDLLDHTDRFVWGVSTWDDGSVWPPEPPRVRLLISPFRAFVWDSGLYWGTDFWLRLEG